MFDLFDCSRQLDAGVNDPMLVFEERGQRTEANVTIFIDRRSNHCAAMLTVPRRVVCPAAEQRNPERSPAHHHGGRDTCVVGCGWRVLTLGFYGAHRAAPTPSSLSSSNFRRRRRLVISCMWRIVSSPNFDCTILR